MSNSPITVEQVLSKKVFAHFTPEQAQELIDSIATLCEVVYENIKQNTDLLSGKGANLNHEKELVYLKKAA